MVWGGIHLKDDSVDANAGMDCLTGNIKAYENQMKAVQVKKYPLGKAHI